MSDEKVRTIKVPNDVERHKEIDLERIRQATEAKPAEGKEAKVAEKNEKAKRHKTPMPRWMIWTRRITAASLIIWIAVAAMLLGLAMIQFMPFIIISIIVAAYAFSKRRGFVGTAFIVLLSASVLIGFSNIILLQLLAPIFGPPPLGMMGLIKDWIADPNICVVQDIALTVRSQMLLSTGATVFATFLLGLKWLRRFEASRVAKFITVGAVLLPIVVICLMPVGELPVNPSPMSFSSSGFGSFYLYADAHNTTRMYEEGRWVYSLYLQNPYPVNVTIMKIIAWHEAIEPLSTRVAFTGKGISISAQGISFEPGASGFITFETALGHNRVTLLLTNNSMNTFSWW